MIFDVEEEKSERSGHEKTGGLDGPPVGCVWFVFAWPG
jgi:hypothetical protein